MTINERIRQVQELSGLTITAYAKRVGIAQTSLRACIVEGTEPKYGTLEKILLDNPEISAEWLMRGEGEMIKGETIDQQDDFRPNQVSNIEEYIRKTVSEQVDEKVGKILKKIVS